MDLDIPTYSIRAANDRGISRLLDELSDAGMMMLTKRDVPVALLLSPDPEAVRELRTYNEEMAQEAFAEGDEGFGRLGLQASSLVEWGLQQMEESGDPEAEESELVYTVTTVNQKGISWMFKTAEQLGMLMITRYGHADALVMAFTPEGISRYADKLVEIANRAEDQARFQLDQTIRRARQIRSMSALFRDQIRPIALKLQEDSDTKDEEEEAEETFEQP